MSSLRKPASLEYTDYKMGGSIMARIDPTENRAGFGPTVEIAIVRLIEPRTMSCGMVVHVKEPGLPPREAFLKIYDRRLSPYFREFFNGRECHRWSIDLEEQYMDTLRQEGLPVGEKHYENNDMSMDKWHAFSAVEKEHVFQQRMRKIHHDEREAYRRLEKHQGEDIPRLYASVYLGARPPDLGNDEANNKYSHLLEVRGHLLEFIHGFELLQIPRNLGYRNACRMYERSIEIVKIIGAHGVLNYDVKLDNFMVTYDPHKGQHRVIMIDLGFCHFRHKQYTTAEWAKLKALAWDGEFNQLCLEAKHICQKRFGNEVSLDIKSEYGFLVRSPQTRGAPPHWVQMQTSKGPAYVNPEEVPCRSSICNPPRNVFREVRSRLRRWTHHGDSSVSREKHRENKTQVNGKISTH